MKKSKFEISKVTPSGGKNVGIRKSEFVTKTQILNDFLVKSCKVELRKITLLASEKLQNLSYY